MGVWYYDFMARIISFVGNDAQSGSVLIFNLAKTLSRKYKVCVFDMDFGMNQTCCVFENFPKYDLKDCLIGEKRFFDVVAENGKNLFLVKSNNLFFDYLKHKEDIKLLVKNHETEFDFLFIVNFVFDERKMSFINSFLTEIIFIIDNSLQSICFAKSVLKKAWKYECIVNRKVILNNHKVIAEINKKSLSKSMVESTLKTDVLFVKGKIKFSKKKEKKEMELLAKSIDENTPIFYNYKKQFNGVIGYFRRRIYEKFEW